MRKAFYHLLIASCVFAASERYVRAESNSTNILDGVTNDVSGPFVLGESGSFNFLLLTNAAALTNTTGIIGNQSGAHSNLAVVTGTGTVWQNNSNFILGATGAVNELRLSGGARFRVESSLLSLGQDPASSNNLLSVSGPDTFLDMTWFNLGVSGSGNQIVVTEGARVGRGISNDLLNDIGVQSTSSDNVLLVDGPGTSWFTDGFRVGLAGPRNQLVIRNGARMTNGFITVGREASATENSALIRGVGSILHVQNASAFLGFDAARNRLTVDEGGFLRSYRMVVGLSNNATFNRAEVTGAGSEWSDIDFITVGRWGASNSVSVADGATLRAPSVLVGERSSGNRLEMMSASRAISSSSARGLVLGEFPGGDGNTALFDGTGTAWSNRAPVMVGGSGSGNQLIVRNGAEFNQRPINIFTLSIGVSNASRSNLVVVTGSGSRLIGPPIITVGQSGSANQLVVAEGARLESWSTDIGLNCIARDNLALITGAGTVWSNGQLQVGFCSTNNHLIISNGATVLASLVRSSVQGGAGNTITVAGENSLLRAAGDFVLGNSGHSNRLLIIDGGRVEGRNDRVGLGGFGNLAHMSGAGSSWTNLSLIVGENTGPNGLFASDGAQILSGSAIIGKDAKSGANIVTLTGPDTRWSVASSLSIGSGGRTNRLRATAGALVESGSASIGGTDYADLNAVELTGAGTRWNVSSNFHLGVYGDENALTIGDGAGVTTRNLYLAASDIASPPAGFPSDANLIRIEGSDSTLSVSSNALLGYNGSFNRVEILNGGALFSPSAVLGMRSGSRSNSVLVSGSGTLWHNTNGLIIGSNGFRSELTVMAGGRVISGPSVLSAGAELYGGGSICSYWLGGNRVRVTDPGSLWDCRGPLLMGKGGIENSLIISNGGLVSATGLLLGMTNGMPPGSVCPPIFPDLNQLIVRGGCLTVSNESQSAVLEVQHGGLTFLSGRVFADQLTQTNGALSRVEFQGGTMHLRSAFISNVPPFTVGDGLHRANLQIEPLFLFNDLGTLTVPAGLVVQPHALLTGRGRILGASVSAGTIAPGSPLQGNLIVNGSLDLLPGSVMHFDLAGITGGFNYDRLTVVGGVTLNGSLRVSLRNGYVPPTAQNFSILSAPAITGSFSNAPFGSRVKTTDNLGSLLVTSNATGILLSDYQSTDLDGDGIEDAWATNHFGHTPLSAAEKADDADGDGMSNHEEFRASTDQNDPFSVLKLTLSYNEGAATLRFPCADGKDYRVWSSPDLLTWMPVENPTFVYPNAGFCEWTDDGKDTGGLGTPTRFFRVTVE